MARYRQGLAIGELRERFFEDVKDRSLEELEALYGADRARFVGVDAAHHFRPTSVHAGSPFYRDAVGREYTPFDTPESREWLVRIPPQFARRAAAAVRAGDRPAPADLVDFPRQGETLALTRVRYGRGAHNDAAVVARVQRVVDTNARASCVIILYDALPAAHTDTERAALDSRAETAERRRRERADRRY